ncbi:family 16 glycoside hydrolase [Sphingobacterium sp. MYb388]|uniref:family 16 glycoside hydrolase n=1 Tax=Sphingobacterium sp. MYb388 TaxID=2745437 RepID=UPI0030A312D4
MIKNRTQQIKTPIVERMVFVPTLVFTVFSMTKATAQQIRLDEDRLTAVQTSMSITHIKGQKAVRVVKSAAVKEDDEATYVKINDFNFKNGVIEVLSRLLPDAPAHARGFIGLAFRINEDDSKFESIYVRPTNSTADDQLRRNRTIQYFSYPNFKFTHSRATAPGQYESYAPIALDEWIKLKIEVNGDQAKLFINGSKQPYLIVNDLKMGADQSGSLGLFVDIGTEGFFRNLKVSQTP